MTDPYHTYDNLPNLRTPGSASLPGYPYGDHTDTAPENENQLMDLLQTFKKHEGLIVFSTVGLAVIAFIACLLMDKQYTATATLEIRGYEPVLSDIPVENLYGADTRRVDYPKTTTSKLTRMGVADKVLSSPGVGEEIAAYLDDNRSSFLIDSIKQLFRSAMPEDETKDKDPNFVHRPSLLEKYLGNISVTPVRETSLVQVTASTTSPRLSEEIANAHARVFIEDLARERQESIMGNLKLLQRQADDLKVRLTKSQQDLSKYAGDNQILAAANSEDANMIVKHIVNLTTLLGDATGKRVRSESLLREVEGKDPKTTPSIIDDDSQRQARTSLQQAEAEYAGLLQRVTPEYPQMLELRAKIQALKSTLKDNYRRIVQGLRMQFESDRAAEQKLIEQIDRETERAHDVSKRLLHYNLLLKESESLRSLYESVLRQVQQIQMTGATTSSNIFISDYASLPDNWSFPPIKILVMLAALLGFGIGCVGALVIETFNNTVVSPDDAALVSGFPFLGFVPPFEEPRWGSTSESLLKVWELRKALPSGGNGVSSLPEKKGVESVPPVELSSRDKISLAMPRADVAEALRTIRAGIILSSADNPPKALMVTSVAKGDGKTTLAANLAVSLAEAGHRTLLMDVDLRQGRIASLFNLSAHSAGLVDYLTGRAGMDEAITETDVPNLEVVPSGPRPPNPAELVGSRKMEDFVRTLRDTYDYIVLDSPPVLPVADALMLTRIIDAALLVIRSNVTDRMQAREARARLIRVRARILGVVLNDFDAKSHYAYSEYYYDESDFQSENRAMNA